MKRTHAITLFVLLGLSALLSRPHTAPALSGDSFNAGDFSLAPTALRRRSLEGFTIAGVRLGEPMSSVIERMGKPVLSNEPHSTCVLFSAYWWGPENGTLHIAGLGSEVEVLEGDSIERTGIKLAYVGQSRVDILRKIGSPEQSLGEPDSSRGYDSYWPEGVRIGYIQGRLDRVWATDCAEALCEPSQPHYGAFCCNPESTYNHPGHQP